MFNNDNHKNKDYCCTPPVRKAGPYCGPVDTTPVGAPYNSHADCHHKPDCGYHIPPVPPFPPGTSLEFQMQALNHKMDELICKYNGCLDNYECVRNELLNSFCCNEAYYNEVWTEDYLDPTMNATVHVVHIPFVDKCGRPIRLELGLAYDNTGNTGVTEEAYHASKRVLADKLFPANNTVKSAAFDGPVLWNGAPYNYGSLPEGRKTEVKEKHVLGVTKSGFLKVYPLGGNVNAQAATIAQMQKDGIENAMQCLSYVLDSKVIEDPFSLTGPFVGLGMNFSTRERFIILVDSTPSEVSGTDIAALFTKYNCTVGVLTCYNDCASLMDKGQFVSMPATVDTSSTDPATQIVPEFNSFWYITKSEYYNSEYTKEVADLMQDVGALEWKYNMSMVAIESNNLVVAKLNQKIETEITDRKEADTTLDNRITQEVAELNSRIDEEVETLNASITAVQNNLDSAVETINTRIDSEVAKLNQAIQAEETRAEAAESALDEKIQAETTRATEAETNLDNKIQAETTRATEAEKDLDEKIDAETNARQEAVNSEAATRAANDIVSVELIQDGTKNTYRLKTGGDTYLEVPIELYDYAMLVSKMQDLTNVQQNLASEVEARQTADDEIRASVTKEASTRQTKDTELQNQIDDLNAKQSDYVNKAGDTMTGDLNMSTHKITGVATPTGNTDAANKEYVDNAISGDYLPTAGGTMQGGIDMNGNAIQNVKDPINAQDAANKEYVDSEVEARQTADDEIRASVTKEASTRQTKDTELQNQIDDLNAKQSDYVNKAGDTMTGDLNMSTHKITGLATPTGNTDAASKEYVDSLVSGDYLPTSGGTMSGNIDMNGNAIQNVKDPVNAQDAANKEYVDAIGEGVGKNFLPTAGGTMTGPIRTEYFLKNYPQFYAGPEAAISKAAPPKKLSELLLGASNSGGFGEEDTYATLTLSMVDNNAYLELYKQAPDAPDQSTLVGIGGVNDPENEYDAANKKYVDDAVKGIDLSGYLPLAGGTMTGDISMDNHSITGAEYLGGASIGARYIFNDFDRASNDTVVPCIKFGLEGVVFGKMNRIDEFMNNSIRVAGVANPSTAYDAANKQYVDSQINTVHVTTPITIFPLSTGNLSLVSQSGKIEDKTGVIYATAKYKVDTEISGGVRIALQNTVSGDVIPTNITGVVNACDEDDGPAMMSAMKAAFYKGYTYLYTDGTLPVGEFIYINFMGFKEV